MPRLVAGTGCGRCTIPADVVDVLLATQPREPFDPSVQPFAFAQGTRS